MHHVPILTLMSRQANCSCNSGLRSVFSPSFSRVMARVRVIGYGLVLEIGLGFRLGLRLGLGSTTVPTKFSQFFSPTEVPAQVKKEF